MQKKERHINLSIVIFLIILIYVVISMLGHVFRNKVSTYEVKADHMDEIISTTGIAVRSEKIVKSKEDGYINYFVSDMAKVYKNQIIYSMDTNGKIKNYIAEEIAQDPKASVENSSEISGVISDFQEKYKKSEFEDVYSLKQKLDNVVLNANGTYIEKTLQKIKNKYGDQAYRLQRAKEAGVISYTNDNFNKTNVEDITEDDFRQAKYKKDHVSSSKKIKKGDFTYRIVDSENWQIAMALTKDQYEQLKERDSITVIFTQDNVRATAEIELKEKKNKYYGYLSLSKYMVRYINERFLNIELSLGTDDGYRIPKTAVAEKDFYQVPIEYLSYTGSASNECVVAKSKGDKQAETKDYTIYKFEEDKENYFYLDAGEVKKDTMIVGGQENSSGKQFLLEKTVKKKGIYSVNRGYARFRPIEIVYEGDDFYLISSETVEGVSLYDRIASNGSKVDEKDLIY